jgi:hypothetical protein
MILWLMKEWLSVPGHELGGPLRRRIIKGQSHEINDFLQDSMAGKGVAVPGRELGGWSPWGALFFAKKRVLKGQSQEIGDICRIQWLVKELLYV